MATDDITTWRPRLDERVEAVQGFFSVVVVVMDLFVRSVGWFGRPRSSPIACVAVYSQDE